MAWQTGITHLEDCEDADIAVGLTEVDTGSQLTLNDNTVVKEGVASMECLWDGTAAYIQDDPDTADYVLTFWHFFAVTPAWTQRQIVLFRNDVTVSVLRVHFGHDGATNAITYKLTGSAADSSGVMTEGAWYCLSIHFVQNGNSLMTIYAADHSVVEELTAATADSVANDVRVGDVLGASNDASVYFDNLAFGCPDYPHPLWDVTSDIVIFRRRIEEN